ncbi:MAG: adenosyl-hopene transferase HpnH [Planctomycetaceae bacterium]|nr:adenosyl-hopene transferase HpnH [Planctomycetaceae bacterium]
MRFPLSLTMSMATYMLRKKLSGFRKGGTAKFPLVLMLEPLHACNLKCSGCGRIREYADTLGQRLSVDECLHALRECGAPIVSICGGEPLLYPDIVELTDKILGLGKHIYLCTNGVLLEEKLDDFVQLAKQNKRTKSRLYWNVHLDGADEVHDAIVEKPGAFDQALGGIFAAKWEGFYVYTNTTLYKTSSVDDLVRLANILHITGSKESKIDGMMIAPGYGYEAVQSEGEQSFFLNRSEIHELFREIRQRMKKYRLTATPIYMDFLCGERELPCAAWANPTYNVRGWKSPCYLMTDKHYETFAEFMQETDWSKIGGNNVGRNNDGQGNDPRCQDCMMHCGYEPAAVLFGNRLRDLLRMALWQMKIA